MAEKRSKPENNQPGQNQKKSISGNNQDDKQQSGSSVNRGLGSADEEMQQNLSSRGKQSTSRLEDEDMWD